MNKELIAFGKIEIEKRKSHQKSNFVKRYRY